MCVFCDLFRFRYGNQMEMKQALCYMTVSMVSARADVLGLPKSSRECLCPLSKRVIITSKSRTSNKPVNYIVFQEYERVSNSQTGLVLLRSSVDGILTRPRG